MTDRISRPDHETTESGANRTSRRRLLQGAVAAAGLTIAWSSAAHANQQGSSTPASGSTPASAATPTAAPARLGPPTQLDAYLRINPDGSATLFTGKVEYGQGIRTGFGQLAAEQLSLPFASVEVVMGETDVAPWDLGTFGSLSTRTTGPRILQAAATMRAWLLDLGAEALGQDASALTLQDGRVMVTGDPTKVVSYATLAAGKASQRELDAKAPLKDPSTFTVIGQSIPRPDVDHKVNGSAIYGIDAHLEGMAWGAVVRPPSFGATLQDVDFSPVQSLPGYVGSYRNGDFAGIVFERYEQVQAAISQVKSTWKELNTGTTSDNIFDVIVKTADDGTELGVDDSNGTPTPAPIMGNVTKPLEVTFRAPYVNHCPIEPRNALVEVTDTDVNVWSSTQDPFSVRAMLATLLKREPTSVHVHPMAAGGAFGSKILPMAEPEAAQLSNAVGRPVKVLWRRDEEIANGQYRPATLVKISTGLGADGKIASWNYDLYSASYFPEGSTGKEHQNGAASDWSADVKEIYALPFAKTMWYQGAAPLPPYYWRVNGATQNTWAREVTMDMLAEMAGQDPVTFRKAMLGDNQRMAAVMDAAVAQAGWSPGVGKTGQGIGIALGFDADSFVAQVARIEVDDSTGEIFARQVDAIIDCGLIVNPEAVKHQIEGAVTLGVSSALREIITFDNGKVTNASFKAYAPITMREAPLVNVGFVEDKMQPMTGVGEPGVAPITAAIANALYDLKGIRIFETPFTPDRVLAAMKGGNATPAATPAG